MKRRILFVDDERNVLDGLRRMLRPMRQEWDMEFTESGQDALNLLTSQPFDVIVTDMRMPGMDGGKLLTEVMEHYPHMTRIILSGHSDQEMILKSVGPTHQFLSKPCDAEKLKTTLASALAIRDLLRDEKLIQLVSNLKSLPSLPTLYFDLMKELQSPDVTMTRVGQIISQDVGMTAKILQLVNSSFFGLAVHVSDPIHAARLLGPEILKALVLSVQVFASFHRSGVGELSVSELSDHSLAVSNLARQIAKHQGAGQKTVERAMIAGMLHDVGKLVLSENLQAQYREILSNAEENERSIYEAELEMLGASHSEVGAYLLGLWGLPDDIVEAVAFHHTPSQCAHKTFTPLTAVHAANALEHVLSAKNGQVENIPIDAGYLQELGLSDALPVWEEICTDTYQQELANDR